MTLLNFTPECGNLKAVAFKGESLPGPRIMEGYSHMLIKPPGDVIELYNSIVKHGLIQHWGSVHGDITSELDILMRLLGNTYTEHTLHTPKPGIVELDSGMVWNNLCR
jgi:hypothetical protein